MLYICPKCRSKLEKVQNSYKCINNHLYDISKKNYINFLLSNDKNSINPGDSKDSLEARHAFLNKGYYEFIFNKVNELLSDYNNINLLDIGCGEGYYTYNIKKNNPTFNVYGFDISKEAISLATRYTKTDVNWFVANSKNIPINDNSIDIVIAMFSFVTPTEIARVLKSDGIIIQVCANNNHLIELKEIVYDNVIEKNKENVKLPFKLINSFNYNTKITINNNEDIINLFKMTPHYYKVKKDNKILLDNLNNINITLDIIINVYKKD